MIVCVIFPNLTDRLEKQETHIETHSDLQSSMSLLLPSWLSLWELVVVSAHGLFIPV